jgi:tRNA modification GTPase
MATAPGRAGVAVARLSGPDALAAFCRLTGREVPSPRLLTRVRLTDPADGSPIDDGLAVFFPAPASFTGEDVVEFHIHGGRAAPAALIAALTALPGIRPAEPGAFSRRAFENGKLDLTAAEGIADLVEAETAAQRRQALRQMEGELGRLYDGWRHRLLIAMARLEATIDFSDEPIPDGLEAEVRRDVAGVADEMAAHLADGRRGERLRDGLMLAIVGAPNVGKSSLLNRLARRDAAIVAETAGTTRDVIEVHLDVGGYPVTVADTAGLRESVDAIEREGVNRARERARTADIRLVILDATMWPAVPADVAGLLGPGTILAINKVDLHRPAQPITVGGQPALSLSARTGEGFDDLLVEIGQCAATLCGSGASPALTRARHRTAVEDAVAALRRLAPAQAPELAAEELRLACRAIGGITGRIDIEDMLDVIFREFCIGK